MSVPLVAGSASAEKTGPLVVDERQTVGDVPPPLPASFRGLLELATAEQWTGRASLRWRGHEAELWLDHGRVLTSSGLSEASEELGDLLGWEGAGLDFEHGVRRTGACTPIPCQVLLRNADRARRGRLPLLAGLEAHEPVRLDVETAMRSGVEVPVDVARHLDGSRGLFRVLGALSSAERTNGATSVEAAAEVLRALVRAGALRRGGVAVDGEPVDIVRSSGGWRRMLSWLVGDDAEPPAPRRATSTAATIHTVRATLVDGKAPRWDLERPAIGASPSATKAGLITALAAELDTCEHDGDRLFVAQLARSVRRGAGVPELPAALTMLAAPGREPQMDDVIRVVKSDRDLEVAVKRRANAATYGRPTGDLRMAIARIGIARIGSMTAWRFLSGSAFALPTMESTMTSLRFLAATTSELASELAPMELRGELRLAGLFHEVGRYLVLRASIPPAGERRPLEGRVRSVMAAYAVSVSHVVVGGWGLSHVVCESVARHPDAGLSSTAPESARILRVARIAAMAADAGPGLDRRAFYGAMRTAGEPEPDTILARAREIRDELA